MKNILKILCLLLVSSTINAQDTLRLDDAIDIALERNFGLQVADKQVELAKNQVFKGNAGMTPVVDINANTSSTFNQVHQNYIDGRLINRFGTSLSPNANVAMQYTLYNGRRMQTIYERLKTQAQLSEVQKQLTLQSTLSDVMEVYYTIQRLQSTREYINTIISYYEERQKITEERWQIGRGSKLDFLQSKADLTIQLTERANNDIQLKNAKVALNRLLARNPQDEFLVEKESEEYPIFDLGFLLDQMRSQNPDILLLRKQEEINLLNQKEAKSFLKPTINLNSSFGYNFSYNNAGLIKTNQSTGLNAGLSASWRIFDGKVIKRNIESSKINGEIIKVQKDQLLNDLDNQIIAAYHQYENQKRLADLERENIATAKENLEISAEKFKLGASTILEMNDAQTRFNTIMNRLVTAEYNLRISKLNLLTLSGELLK